MNRRAIGGLLLALSAAGVCFGDVSDDFYSAIRANDMKRLTLLAQCCADVNTADRLGETPLMYAATVGSLDAMKFLVEKGANVNAQSASGATALIWSATDLAKVRFLLEHGANVNLATKRGRTALLIAAMSDKSYDIVKLLIDKGADVKAVDFLHTTPLRGAVLGNDTRTIRLLIDAGVDVNAADLPGISPLMIAAGWNGNVEATKALLAKGANVNAVSRPVMGLPAKNGASEFGSLTALTMAAAFGPPDLVRTLIDAGADVNARDVRGMSPLMLAVATDHQDPAVIRMLIEHGADPKLTSKLGDNAIDWAGKNGQAPGKELLKVTAGAQSAGESVKPEPPAANAKAAVERIVPLVEKSSWEFFAASGCVSCHAQSMTDWVAGAARAKSFAVDEKAAAERVKMLQVVYPTEPLLERMDAAGAMEQIAYPLVGLAANHYPADRMTDAFVANVAAQQRADGAWHVGAAARPPAEEGDIFRTAVCLRALQAYAAPGRGAEMTARVNAARDWLKTAKATTTEDRNMQLLGLYWGGVSAKQLKPLAQAILAKQLVSGGWTQHDGLTEADAYATGETLYALATSGVVTPKDAAWKRGAKFLLDTQHADGSWYVKSRTARIQAHFEGGFPYHYDQWISNWGTSWAALALMADVNRPATRAAK